MIKLIDHYHPERHYMRGPGPKWHERNARTDKIGKVLSDMDASLRNRMLWRFRVAMNKSVTVWEPYSMTQSLMKAELTKHLKIVVVAAVAAIVVVTAISAQL